MKRPNTQILSHSQITSLITFEGAIDAVQKVMEAHGRSQVIAPNLLHADTPRGEFHIKTGGVLGSGVTVVEVPGRTVPGRSWPHREVAAAKAKAMQRYLMFSTFTNLNFFQRQKTGLRESGDQGAERGTRILRYLLGRLLPQPSLRYTRPLSSFSFFKLQGVRRMESVQPSFSLRRTWGAWERTRRP